MKVLLVNDFYSPHMVGGAETIVRTIAQTLSVRGHSVAICTARIGSLPAESIDSDSTRIFRVGSFPALPRSLAVASGSAPARLAPGTAAEFEAVLRMLQPDVIHFHNVWLLGPGVVLICSVSKERWRSTRELLTAVASCLPLAPSSPSEWPRGSDGKYR
jgi:hypothetical protein